MVARSAGCLAGRDTVVGLPVEAEAPVAVAATPLEPTAVTAWNAAPSPAEAVAEAVAEAAEGRRRVSQRRVTKRQRLN